MSWKKALLIKKTVYITTTLVCSRKSTEPVLDFSRSTPETLNSGSYNSQQIWIWRWIWIFFKKFRTNSRSCNENYMMVPLADFNAKCTSWYKHDKINFEGIAIENISSQCEWYQVINEPTHISENSSSCIDLIFTSRPNLNTESGVHPSLHPNCHHQVIYAKFDLKVHYLVPYERRFLHYKEADTDFIQRSIKMFDWDRAFKNSNVNDMVDICTKTI